MKRLLAAVAAIAMVAGAIAVRDVIDGDDTSSGGNGGGSDETFRLTCATELADACEAIEEARDDVVVTDEDPGATSDRLVELAAGEDPGFDAWLVDGPWEAITADNRSFAGTSGGVLGEASDVLARSPALIVAREETAADLAAECGGTITWRCVGEQAGSLRVGLATPERGDGIVTLAEAVGSFFGTTDYAANDFAQPGFSAWFDDLTELSTQDSIGRRSPLAAALAQAGLFDVVGALESQAARLLRGRDGFAAIYPEPMSIAEVTLVPRDGIDATAALDRLGSDTIDESLAAEGWRTGGSAPGDLPEGVDAPASLPDGANLPAPGVLQQLRELW